jgi:hypothetical protein
MLQNNPVSWALDWFLQESEQSVDLFDWLNQSKPDSEPKDEDPIKDESKEWKDEEWKDEKTWEWEQDNEEKDENVPYHKNKRFQELRQAKKDFENKYKESQTKLEELESKLRQLEAKKSNDDFDSDEEKKENKLDIDALKQELLSELQSKMSNSKQTEEQAMELAKQEFNEAVLDLQDDWIEVDSKEFAKWVTKLWDLETAKTVYSEIKNSKKEAVKSFVKKKSVENISNNKVNSSNSKLTYKPWTSWSDMWDLFNKYVSR